MSRFSTELSRLIEQALENLKLPASQIDNQLSGGQVAPAASGSPGVVDLDAIPSISADDPQPLGVAAPGTSGEASDAAHVHPMPDAADVGAEPALGDPASDGYVLSSSAAGVRLWVPQSGGAPLSDATPLAPGTASAGDGTAASRDDHVHAPPSAAQISDLLETTQDTVAAMISAGANISLSYDDSAGTLTISVSGVPGHASSHASGGADPVAISASQIINVPSVRADLGGTNQSISNNTITVVALTAVTGNDSANYDATLHRYTPTLAGTYLVVCRVLYASMADAAAMITYLRKNGVSIDNQIGSASGTGLNCPAPLISLIEMDGSEDYLEMTVLQASGAGRTLLGGTRDTVFTAVWVGP